MSLTRGLALSPIPGGLDQWTDRVDVTIPRLVAGTATTAAFTSTNVYLYRFQLARPLLITKIALYCGATVVASSIDLGIYTGTIGGTTFTRAASTGAFTPSTNAATERALSASIALDGGTPYWVAIGVNDGTDTILRVSTPGANGDAGNNALVKAGAWSSGLPSSIATPAGTNIVPWLSLVTT